MDHGVFSERLAAALVPRHLSITDLDYQPREAAVMAIFRPAPAGVVGVEPGEPELLLIRRAEVDGDPWSGHVAFPGGQVEPEDASPLDGALRETLEEVGLDLRVHGRLLGELPQSWTIPVRGRRMLVHPYVYSLDLPQDPVLNDEVARLFWVPLRVLLVGTGRGTMTWGWKGQQIVLPCVRFQGERLWGMTLRMVEDLLRAWRSAA